MTATFSWSEDRSPKTLTELWDACQSFDWYYGFSDDHRVWRTWVSRRKLLMTGVEALGIDGEIMYGQWRQSKFNSDTGFDGHPMVPPPRPE